MNKGSEIESNDGVLTKTKHGGKEVLKVVLSELHPLRLKLLKVLSENDRSKTDRLERIPQVLPEVTLVERSDLEQDEQNGGDDCVHDVFKSMEKQPWSLKRGEPDSEEFVRHTLRFLEQHGYEVVTDAPQNGDVVAYGTNLLGEMPRWPSSFEHFGIWRDGKVRSKFGFIYSHPLAAIPPHWGDEAIFLRKKRQAD